jgi:hypothetical protein
MKPSKPLFDCLVDAIPAQLPALYFLMVSHLILHTSMNPKKPAKQTKQTRYNNEIAPGFASVVNAFVEDKQVTRDEGKGFGSGALKVNGKIFAMMTSQHKFVVKLPKERLDELVRANLGENFAPRPGRLMIQESGARDEMFPLFIPKFARILFYLIRHGVKKFGK